MTTAEERTRPLAIRLVTPAQTTVFGHGFGDPLGEVLRDVKERLHKAGIDILDTAYIADHGIVIMTMHFEGDPELLC